MSQFIEVKADYIECDSWTGYNASRDADYFKINFVPWVSCPFCGREFNPENQIRACSHFIDFIGNWVLFQNLEEENDN